MKVSTRFSAAVAIAAAAAAAAILPASSAFAANGPSSSYTGTVVIASTLNIQPSTGSFTLNAVPGQTASPPPFTITLTSSDSAGYSVAQALTTQFGSIPNPNWSTDVAVPPDGTSTNNWHSTPTAYNAAGDAITVFSWGGVSGSAGNGVSGGPVSSSGGDDIFSTQVHLALPGNYPGSPAGGYHGAFNYTIIGA